MLLQVLEQVGDTFRIQPQRARNLREAQRRAMAGQLANHEISHRMVMRRHESQIIAHAMIVPWYIDNITCRSLSSCSCQRTSTDSSRNAGTASGRTAEFQGRENSIRLCDPSGAPHNSV